MIDFTLEELTVIACAVDSHQKHVDKSLGVSLTRVHTDVIEKIRAHCQAIERPGITRNCRDERVRDEARR